MSLLECRFRADTRLPTHPIISLFDNVNYALIPEDCSSRKGLFLEEWSDSKPKIFILVAELVEYLH